ncbi:MAG: hypothetical protein AAFO82_06695, partial [Bacteroidota bacterium]
MRTLYYVIFLSITIAFALKFIWFSEEDALLHLEQENLKDVAVEFHGMIFDLIIFGIFLAIYEGFLEKRKTARRYREEIEELKRWDSEEAAYRTAANIRKLSKISKKSHLIKSGKNLQNT